MSLNVCAVGTMVRATRKARGMTQQALADQAGVSRRAVILLEGGGGRLSTLARVVPVIDLRLTGLAAGPTLGAQVQRTRVKRRMTQAELADKAAVSIPCVHALETDRGLVASLSAVLTVLAPTTRPRQHPRATWAEARDERFTPPAWLLNVVDVYGPISIDPCFHPKCFVRAEAVLTQKEDGLATRWNGRLAFVNPPYSESSKWIRRCADAWEGGEVSVIVSLLPARTETAAFHERVLGKARTILLRNKPRFYNEEGNRMSIAPFAAMFCIWGGDDRSACRLASLVGGAVIVQS